MLSRIVVVALIAAAVIAGPPTFTICGAGSLTGAQVTSVDADWKAGTTVTFTVSGELNAPIVAGATAHSVAKFSGSEVENKTDDLCTYSGTPFQCPVSTGAQSWTFPFAIPNIPFAGTLTSQTDFKNADGSVILCLQLEVKL